MSVSQKIKSVITSVLYIALALILILKPDNGMIITAAVLSLALLIYGIRFLYFYFTLSRHMVGGRRELYISVILLDLAFFVLALKDIPQIYIAIYLIIFHILSGVIDFLRSVESLQFRAPVWRFKLISGIIHIIIAVLCVVFIRSTEILVYVYSAGLIYSAATRIINAFSKKSFVYIQ